jgi:hypothetical protein
MIERVHRDLHFTWEIQHSRGFQISNQSSPFRHVKQNMSRQQRVCHAIWLRRLLKDINFAQHEATPIYLDSKSTIELAKNPVHHERIKHIDVKYHFIREQVKEKKVELIHVGGEDQVADIFTKPLPTMKFEKFKNLLGMKDVKEIKFTRVLKY